MTTEKLTVVNALSGYVRLLARMITSLLLLRIVLNHLNSEAYGFWTLLYCFFSHTALMTLGLGFSMQKFVPQYVTRKDFRTVNEIVNTVFFIFVAFSVVIFLCTIGLANYLDLIFKFQSDGVPSEYKSSFVIFGTLTALSFPLGLFEEVLAGLQRLYVREFIMSASHVSTLLAAYVITTCNGGLVDLVTASSTTTLLAQLACLLWSLKYSSGIKIHPKYFRPRILLSILPFSSMTSLISAANHTLDKGAHLLIASFASVTGVGVYQVASKLPECLSLLTMQVAGAIFPYASQLGARNHAQGIRKLIDVGTKATVFLLAPLAVCILFFSKDILAVWLGNVDEQVFPIIPPLVLTACFARLYDVSERTFIMNEGEKKVAFIRTIEAALVISIGLIGLTKYGLAGFAWTAFICKVSTLLFMLHPMLARFCGFSYWTLVRILVTPFLLPLLAFTLSIAAAESFAAIEKNVPTFLALVVLGFTIYGVLFWRVALQSEEKQELILQLCNVWKAA